jgi:hypothetical protein
MLSLASVRVMLLLLWQCFLVREVSDDAAGILMCLGVYRVPVAVLLALPGCSAPPKEPFTS